MPSIELLRVRDLVPDFLACLDECAGTPAATWPARWRSRYLGRHHDVFRSLDRDGEWTGAENLAATLLALRDRAGDLAARADAVRALLPDGVTAVCATLGWSDPGDPVECVVLVGLQRANGWADPLDGRYALFLAVEELGPPGDDRLLVLHEGAHVVHDRLAGIRDWPDHGVANALLTEGLATQVSAELDPGRPDEDYLWFGRPGYRPWLDECRGRWPEILNRVHADLDATDLAHHAAYFLMRDSPLAGDLPKRCGYLVGLAAVRRLRERYALPEIAAWPLPRVRREVRKALTDLLPPV
ncbi:hypothetical protein Q2K19_33210 [Micromonospora soli]|uniref:hypothetical protein n=1 Tax=Micromonospora sp. NBRC 110009 TaxID=3061627 RepID=UPI002672019E|nr:hypothetical protein [Micromonospora sp. NBRC 110009]WKT98932.1 hypothetical protein Q2K19_33210 [Micromonospora sp. NBRC 110009]